MAIHSPRNPSHRAQTALTQPPSFPLPRDVDGETRQCSCGPDTAVPAATSLPHCADTPLPVAASCESDAGSRSYTAQQILRIVTRASRLRRFGAHEPSYLQVEASHHASMTRHPWSAAIRSSSIPGKNVLCNRPSPRMKLMSCAPATHLAIVLMGRLVRVS